MHTLSRAALSSLVTALACLATVSLAPAQTRADLDRCRTISEDSGRLACYDAIRLPGSLLPSKYERIDLADFRTDALTYRGDLVEVAGWLRPRPNGILMLGADADDPAPVPVEYGSLPRRAREDFLDACGEGCAGVVQGRVRPVNFTTGITADTLATGPASGAP